MKNTILIVDDMEINRIMLREMLSGDYTVVEACNGVEATQKLKSLDPLPTVILLDIVMPEMDGYQTLEIIKSNDKTKDIPVLFITAEDSKTNETKALTHGAMDYISKPFDYETVQARVRNHVHLSNYRLNLELLVYQKTKELDSMHMRILETMATIVEFRDFTSGLHIRRTRELMQVLTEHMLKNERYADELKRLNYEAIINASTLHDIGKVGIADEILLKPGRLTEEEFEEMKKHSEIGGYIIECISDEVVDNTMYLKHCRDMCLSHHERWDGKGYCRQLKGEEISLSARMMAIVDVYDALTSKRCYKEPFTFEKAIEIIRAGRGTQFEPNLVDIFLEVSPRFEKLTKELSDK